MIDISIVVPIYNEAENILPLVQEVFSSVEKSGLTAELILVDDGSQDESYSLMCEMAETEGRIRAIRLRRNFGQTAAMVAGFDAAAGRIILPMDGDLQNDPRDIPRLVAKIEEGYDVVSGWRKDRKDRFVTRRLPSILANSLISRLTHVRLHDYGCSMKAYRRDLLEKINLYGELHRFVPALATQVGARVTELPVNHRPRHAGQSKYGIDRTLRVLLDLITVKFLLKYATRPMQLFGKLGFFTTLLAGVSGGTVLYMKWFDSFSMNRNPLTVLTAFLLFSAVQFVMLGLLGELVTRTYHETQGKTVYSIRETRNMESEDRYPPSAKESC